jgi:ribose 5-phosphate isomerase B
VQKNFVDNGIVLCVSGTGAALVANRVAGIRAAAGCDPAIARESREQLDANVLTITAGNVTPDTVLAIVKSWVSAEFSRTDQAMAHRPTMASRSRWTISTSPPW